MLIGFLKIKKNKDGLKLKHFFILLFSFLFLVNIFPVEVTTDWGTNNLKGNVKEITKLEYNIYNDYGETSKELDYKTIYTFNKNIIAEKKFYMPDGVLERRFVYKIDDSGKRIEEDDYGFSGKLSNTTTYKYNKSGNCIEEEQYSSAGEFCYKKIFNYDVNGNRTEYAEYSQPEKLLYKYIYKFDVNGNEIEYGRFILTGELTDTYSFKYDAKGNQIEKLQYDSKGKLVSKYIYKYDNQGKQTELVECEGNAPRSVYIDKYDTKNNVIETNKYSVSLSKERESDTINFEWNAISYYRSLERTYVFKYDDYGNKTEEATYNEKGILSRVIEYQYIY